MRVPRILGAQRFRAGWALLASVTVLLVLGPLLLLAVAPPTTAGHATAVSPASPLTEPHLRRLLFRTLRIATGVTGLALLLGLPLGLWLSRRRGIRGGALVTLHVLPLCLPPYLTALAWTRVLGREGAVTRWLGADAGAWLGRWLYSEAGVVFCLTWALAPVVTLLAGAALRGIDPARVEAGRLARGGVATTLGIELPLALPGIGAAALLVFVLAAGEVAVPQLLRVPVYPTVVFARMADLSFQPGEALALAVPVIALAVLVAAGLHLLDRQGRRARGQRHHPALGASGSVAALGADLLAFLIVATSLVPVGTLILDAGRAAGGGRDAVSAALPALSNSLRYAATAATAMTLGALVFAGLWWRRPRVTSWLSLPLLLGLLLPSAVLAVALVATWNRPCTQWVYRSDLIIGLGLCARYFYVSVRVAKLGHDSLQPSWLEASRLSGAGWLRRLALVRLPLLGDTIVVTFGIAFLLALRDLETIIPFYPPGGESLPVRIMTLEANAPPGMIASTVALQVGVTATLIGVLAAVVGAGAHLRRRLVP